MDYVSGATARISEPPVTRVKPDYPLGLVGGMIGPDETQARIPRRIFGFKPRASAIAPPSGVVTLFGGRVEPGAPILSAAGAVPGSFAWAGCPDRAGTTGP